MLDISGSAGAGTDGDRHPGQETPAGDERTVGHDTLLLERKRGKNDHANECGESSVRDDSRLKKQVAA